MTSTRGHRYGTVASLCYSPEPISSHPPCELAAFIVNSRLSV